MQAFFDLAICVLGEAYLLAQRAGSTTGPPRRAVLVDDDELMARVVTRVFITGGAFTAEARAFLQTVPNLRLEKPFELERLRTLVNAAGT